MKIEDMSEDAFRSEVSEFSGLYRTRAIDRNLGGLEAEGHFILWHVLRNMPKVSTVIESGVWKGISTWLIEKTRPDLKAHLCLDPLFKKDLSILIYRSSKVIYSSCDLSDFQTLPLPGECLVFLDDHVDALPRLEQCVKLGIKNVLFDDNWRQFGDHKSLWMYENTEVSPDESVRFKKVMERVVSKYEFPLTNMFPDQIMHQYMTILRLA